MYQRTIKLTIGANATIVGPVLLGRFCFVGAGSVVTTDVEPFSIVAGVPARLVRRRNEPAKGRL